MKAMKKKYWENRCFDLFLRFVFFMVENLCCVIGEP